MKKTIYVRKKEDWQELLDESKKRGVSVSRIISDAVHFYLSKPSTLDTPNETLSKLSNVNKVQLDRIEEKIDKLVRLNPYQEMSYLSEPVKAMNTQFLKDEQSDPYFKPMPKKGKKKHV